MAILSESELIAKLQSGDMSAYSELLSRFSPIVLNTCYKFLLHRADAEDIAQEVFLEVFQSIHSFHGNSKLSTWMYRIAVTKSLDEIKKRKRKKRISSLGTILRLDEVAEWIGGGKMPDGNIHERETMDEIFHALDALPDNQRIAFTLSKIDGYTNKEIAEIMETSIVATESLISRAKRKVSEELRKILEKK